MKLSIVLAIIAAMIALRVRKAGLLAWVLACWLAIFVALRFGFVTPIPASVIKLYMGIISVALLAYVSSSAQRLHEVVRPLVRLMVEPKYGKLLAAVVILIPAVAAAGVYVQMNVRIEAPGFSRTVHPAPPDRITVHDKEIDLVRATNPFRALESSDPAAFKKHVESGRNTYYRNCFFCHGDTLAGDGMFAHGLNPIPSNFTDPGTIVMLQESFLFWRISKGGPGLPEEGGPWDTAMPAWEKFLSEEEIWEVIAFLYDHTGQKPRAQEEKHE